MVLSTEGTNWPTSTWDYITHLPFTSSITVGINWAYVCACTASAAAVNSCITSPELPECKLLLVSVENIFKHF